MLYWPAVDPEPHMRIGVSALGGGFTAGSSVGICSLSWSKRTKKAVIKLSEIGELDSEGTFEHSFHPKWRTPGLTWSLKQMPSRGHGEVLHIGTNCSDRSSSAEAHAGTKKPMSTTYTSNAINDAYSTLTRTWPGPGSRVFTWMASTMPFAVVDSTLSADFSPLKRHGRV